MCVYMCVCVLDTGWICFAVSSFERIAQIDQVACECVDACTLVYLGQIETLFENTELDRAKDFFELIL